MPCPFVYGFAAGKSSYPAASYHPQTSQHGDLYRLTLTHMSAAAAADIADINATDD